MANRKAVILLKGECMMKSRKPVYVSVPTEIYTNFFPAGTVIDRPGMPLLKIVGAKPIADDKVTVSIDISPTHNKHKHL
jgi:hypothetical protein